MTDIVFSAASGAAAGDGNLVVRRALFAALTITTMAGLLWLAAAALSPGGVDALDRALLLLFAITLPWQVIGFWNGVIGFAIMRFASDPVATVFPGITGIRDDVPIVGSTAVLLCIRNEAPARVVRNLQSMLTGLSGVAGRFHLYVLSDTSDAAIAASEEALFGDMAAAWRDRIAITYRRRTTNLGFKAGNIRDFCERWGSVHEFALTLDADSVMPASAILRLLRVMQAAPNIGILQGLIVGLPATSAMARIFQFGMRLGMRSYTLGSAWWQGDCGPYWGHNAVLRLKPFIACCRLPLLPEGRHLLSHDQIEAALMRRGGYQVRVLPEENLGWEEHPPTLLEFIRRDLRWCQGNMQYGRFLLVPGLPLVVRCQLGLAMLMFLGSPAWIGLLLLGSAAAALRPETLIDPFYGHVLLGTVLLMCFAPKTASVIDVLLRPQARIAFGGPARFVMGIAAETVFSFLLSPIMWLSHTILLGRMLFGYEVRWNAQVRHEHFVPIGAAIARLWPHTVVGLAAIGVLALTNPQAIPLALLIAGGLVLAVPLAVLTASPRIGRWMAQLGMGRLPEETAPPDTLRTLALPALVNRDA